MGKDVEVSIPQPFLSELDVDLSGTLNTNLTLAGEIASDLCIGGKLDNNGNPIPMAISPIEIDMGLDDIKVDMGLDNMKMDMGLDNINACLSFAVKELPSMRMHFPTDYEFGFKLFGLSIFNFNVCGKSMMITEDNPKKMFYTPKHASASTQQQHTDSAASVRVTLDDKKK